jgi:hypothetical protein
MRSTFKRKPIKGLLLTQISPKEPTTIQKVLSRAKASHWKKAINEKLNLLEKNNTWNLTTLPPNYNVIGYKWILKVKFNAKFGIIAKYKARLDFTEMYT